MTSQKRLLRVAGEVKKSLAMIFTRRLKDTPPGLISIPEVRMTPDLLLARVFISVPGDEQTKSDTLRFLKRHNGEIRHLLAGELRLKYVPELQFKLDESLENVDRLKELFTRIEADRQEADGESSPAAEDDESA
ncbi:30S ribosome-binding factor RbfA [bacterium]|nr:30S ribosome-binding factor RbfA [bacterium]